MHQIDHVQNFSFNNESGVITINYHSIKKTTAILRALNHKLRKQIIWLIYENDGITVSEIFNRLMLEQSVASQQLAILRRAGLLKTKRNGKYIHYSVNLKRLDEIRKLVDAFLK